VRPSRAAEFLAPEGQTVLTASPASSDLDLYDIAYLAGGPERAVDTALVALVQTGRIRVHSPGSFAAVGLSRRHPVEAAVLDAIGQAGHRSVDTILWRLADDERLLSVEDRLRKAGLLRRGRWLGRRHTVDRRLMVRTAAGRRTLRRLSLEPPADLVAAGTDAMAVAVGGKASLRDRELSAAVFEGPREARPFRRSSRSRSRGEAAAEAWQDTQRTANVLHSSYNEWSLSPSGPNPRIPSARGTRKERGARR
jgi:hypothetical protein